MHRWHQHDGVQYLQTVWKKKLDHELLIVIWYWLPCISTNHRCVELVHALMDLGDVSSNFLLERIPSWPWHQVKSMVLYDRARWEQKKKNTKKTIELKINLKQNGIINLVEKYLQFKSNKQKHISLRQMSLSKKLNVSIKFYFGSHWFSWQFWAHT